VRCDRRRGERGGGVACFIKKYMGFFLVERKEYKNLELLCFDTKFKDIKLRFCCIYSPPSYLKEEKLRLYQAFDTICSTDAKILIFGDSNINWFTPDIEKHLIKEHTFRNR
jgi:hypothetical protein